MSIIFALVGGFVTGVISGRVVAVGSQVCCAFILPAREHNASLARVLIEEAFFVHPSIVVFAC